MRINFVYVVETDFAFNMSLISFRNKDISKKLSKSKIWSICLNTSSWTFLAIQLPKEMLRRSRVRWKKYSQEIDIQ